MGGGSSFVLLGALHVLGGLAFSIGILFLLFWAFRQLSVAQLWKWGWVLAVAGAVVSLLTFGVIGSGGPGIMNGCMMKDSMMNDGMGMSMHGMTMMLEGKTGDAFDAAFIEMMIPHHQGAIDMAKLAQQNAKHVEIQQMAEDIISAQQREIDEMKQWQSSWGYGQ
jgi:hypothetical protein